MPTSKRKLKANRANAQKSTGPNTVRGKEIAKRNATKHGMYAKDVVLDSPYHKEDFREYDSLVESLIQELKPDGIFQKELVIKIANCIWRSSRIVRAEQARIHRQLEDVKGAADSVEDDRRRRTRSSDPGDWELTPDERQFIQRRAVSHESMPWGESSEHIMRYEMRMDRQLTRTYRLLQQLQKASSSVPEQQAAASAPAAPDLQTHPTHPQTTTLTSTEEIEE